MREFLDTTVGGTHDTVCVLRVTGSKVAITYFNDMYIYNKITTLSFDPGANPVNNQSIESIFDTSIIGMHDTDIDLVTSY
jgi:hypothetical protein